MNNHEGLLKRCFPNGVMLDGDEDEMWDKYFPKEIAGEMKKMSKEPFK
jgi:hypothetical protein